MVRLMALGVAVLLVPTLSSAQSARGRVTRETVILEQPRGDSRVLVTVPAGIVLEIFEQRGDWYRVPTTSGRQLTTGWINRIAFEPLSGEVARLPAPIPPSRAAEPPEAQPPAPRFARTAPPAATDRRWEIEGHAGGAFAHNPPGGTGSLPAAGEPFTTSAGQPSRRASSWYFGDGASLLNEINGTFAFLNVGRITPLDPVLNKAGAARKDGGSVGFRIGYAMTPRFTAEFNLDAGQDRLKLTDAFLEGVDTSRTSFATAFDGLISTGGGLVFTNTSVTSTATIHDERGRQVFATGALTVNLATQGRLVPYATIGGGVLSSVGDLPNVTLAGNYRFDSLNVIAPGRFPVNETDTVTIRVAPDKHAFVTVVGGGVKILGSPRWGVRADVRAYLSKNTVNLLLDASPQVATQTPAGFIASTLSPSMQFSNDPSTGQRSTLSGPAISGFKAFTASGTQVQIGISGGYFVRF